MAIEVNSTNITCSRCGKQYSRRKGYFAVNYGVLYKGIGYLTVCRDCVDSMYNSYLSQCNSSKDAARQVCRKLDLYWSEKVFDIVERKTVPRTVMTTYLSKITSTSFAGKSYDDTLSEEGALWNFNTPKQEEKEPEIEQEDKVKTETEDIPKEYIDFWGRGFGLEDYQKLEARKKEWYSSFQSEDMIETSMKSHIKQICLLELDMDKVRAIGGAPSDKMFKSYTELLGSANLKPVQKQKDDNDSSLTSTPMGVWLDRWEYKRPLPDKYNDSQILKYVFTWLGHTLRMLGKKNAYTQLYQEEIDRLRVEKPEYDGEEDEVVMMDYFNESDNSDG